MPLRNAGLPRDDARAQALKRIGVSRFAQPADLEDMLERTR